MNQNLTLAFPSEWISWHSLVFPKGRQWRAALPFALEEQLASEVTSLSVIPIGTSHAGMGRVAVVAQQDLATFAEQHPHSSAVWTPDFMRLPWQSGQVGVWVESASRWVLRWGEWEGTAGHPQVIQTLLQALPESQRQLIMVYGELDESQLPKDATILRHAVTELPPLKPVFDLRQGAGQGQWQWSGFGAWKLPVGLLAGLLLITGSLSLITSWQQAQATEALQQQTQALLNTHFPEVKRWVNPLAQAKTLAKERLAVQAQLQSSPLVALSRIDAQLVNAPAVSQVKLTAGRIELSWNSPLADAVLSRSITLAGWQAQWLNPQQLLLTVQGDQP
jgi:type II secretion system protein L